jgi:hypothetical protein
MSVTRLVYNSCSREKRRTSAKKKKKKVRVQYFPKQSQCQMGISEIINPYHIIIFCIQV